MNAEQLWAQLWASRETNYKRYAYGIHSSAIWVYMALWQVISNESQMSSIWLLRVPSKPISHENWYHMHFLARNNLKFKFHNKETSTANHRVRYGVRSELCLTLKHNRGVRELREQGNQRWQTSPAAPPVCVPNFIVIGLEMTELWRRIHGNCEKWDLSQFHMGGPNFDTGRSWKL